MDFGLSPASPTDVIHAAIEFDLERCRTGFFKAHAYVACGFRFVIHNHPD
jgi:hypothetical protein